MKKKFNKKLLNLITLCSGTVATVAVGIGGIVYSLQENNTIPLPEEVYKITDKYDYTAALEGFTEEFLNNPNAYKNCNTMLIPINIDYIDDDAFDGKIPSFITKIIFPTKMNNEIHSGYGIFCYNPSIKSVVLPGNLKYTNQGIFMNCSNLSSIIWDAWDCTSFDFNGFVGVAAKGTVKVTHPIDAEHDSAALLATLKQKSSLPEGWTAA